MLIDGLILNSIEFWTGNSVISENSNGDNIKITKNKNGFKAKNLNTGEELTILNDIENSTVYALHKDRKIKLLEYNEYQNTATVFLPNQQSREFNLNEQDIAEVRNEISNYMNLAIK